MDLGSSLEVFWGHLGDMLVLFWVPLEGYFFDGFWDAPRIQRGEKVEGDQGSLEALIHPITIAGSIKKYGE